MLRLFEGGVYLKVGRDQELFTYDIVIFRIKLTELTSFDSDYSQQGQGAYQRFFFFSCGAYSSKYGNYSVFFFSCAVNDYIKPMVIFFRLRSRFVSVHAIVCVFL